MLKAIIFDMDGVIIDSEPQHARAAILAAKKHGVIKINEAYCYRFIGSTTYYMCQCMIQEFHMDTTAEELLADNLYYKKELAEKEGYHPIPYVINLIKNLSANGLRLIIASSSSPKEIEAVLSSLHIGEYFEGYVSGNQVEHPKPAPDIFLKALKTLDLDASECIVIEDSMNGSLAAKHAHIACIGYSDPNSIRQDLTNANMIIEGFEEADYELINDFYYRYYHLARTIGQTNRLCIREYQSTDWNSYQNVVQELTSEKDHETFGHFFQNQTEFDAYVHYNYSFYTTGNWGIFMNDTLIGECGITPINHDNDEVYSLGFFISSKYRHKGYATEAIQCVCSYLLKKEITQIIAVTYSKNEPCQKTIQGLGYPYITKINQDMVTFYIDLKPIY